MTRARSGFTLVEVLVAVTVLSIGLVALAGSSAAVSRMIGRGKIDTRAAQLATQKVDSLRAASYFTTPRCNALVDGGPETTDHVALAWDVTTVGSGRTIDVSATYGTARGPRTQVLTTYIEC